MKKVNEILSYEAPRLEVIEVEIEKGFAATNVYGEDGEVTYPGSN